MPLQDNMALLILDESSSALDMVKCYLEVNTKTLKKYRMNGITVLTNDDAIRGNEDELQRLAGIRFFEDWEIQPMYREMIRESLGGEDVYVMKQTPTGWEIQEASQEDYQIIDSDGLIQAKPLVEIINGQLCKAELEGNLLSYHIKSPGYSTSQESGDALCILIQYPDGAGGGGWLPQDSNPEIDVSKYQTVIFHQAHHDKIIDL